MSPNGRFLRGWILRLAFAWSTMISAPAAPETFRVATYNLENYLDAPAGTRPVKSPESRAQIRTQLRAMHADIVALQEIGSTNALLELRASLRAEGLFYPYWECVYGADTNIQVAVFSRVPIVARRPHTHDSFLLFGRKFRVSRGFAEVDLQINPRYEVTLITAHLKSRRPVPEADESELREQEALALREHVDQILDRRPEANLIVLGDFNDTRDSRAIRSIIGHKHALVDTRPAERNGDPIPGSAGRSFARNIVWTHAYGKEDTFSRIDYILISRGLAREWLPEETYVLAMPNWGLASDHRPVVAGFSAADR